MRMSLYRSILRQAMTVAFRYQYLWFFGLFATLLASNFEIELVNRFTNQDPTTYSWQSLWNSGLLSGQTWHGLMEVARTHTGSFLAIVVLLLVLAILGIALIWLAVVSQAALVSHSSKALAGMKKPTGSARYHDISTGFQEGSRHFWPVLWLNIIVRVLVYGLAAATIIPVMIWTSGRGLGFGLTYLVAFIIFLTLALALALMAKYVIATIVLKGKSLKESIVYSWHLFWGNWLVNFEMAFILFAVSLVATFAIIIAVLVLAIPFVLLYILTMALNSYVLWVLMITIAILFSIAVVIIGGSIVTVFQTTAWVGLYNQLTTKGATSKLERAFGQQ